ncbi:Ribosomal RNA small subunit methyltransferase D [Candidatus Kinetoplastibacterium sorsogonicusi]|uniref:Ribosomal RNA small subunit methyltransferase D n=1 Tax=Candidatus Kinetoplastidibacterium kentomonadis TaxID=1576550 RepID=A0A3S7J9N8_9PROT|nr:RsmD family RNA methyltransferase [Candidatus Kinetoplastibacterium sorsogonicusi]AWD32379.1 Ribosomal RNA small subunit methyltransferase D [Candidatus Kinetoplastibacterium sorsogonicusi]
MKKLNIKNFVKIISGKYKHTKLKVANIPDLRPTPNKIRETLFNWLKNIWNADFDKKHIIDLFAGSGAIGFEAASLGVKHIYMIENHIQAILNMQTTKNKINANTINIYHADSTKFIYTIDIKIFDLIILDPPFNSNYLQQLLPYISSNISKESLIYIESNNKIESDIFLLDPIKQSKFGNVNFGLFRTRQIN